MAEQAKIGDLDGPYLVKGPVVVVDAEGNQFPAERETIALCRCGGSTTKPRRGHRAREGSGADP